MGAFFFGVAWRPALSASIPRCAFGIFAAITNAPRDEFVHLNLSDNPHELSIKYSV